MLYRDSSSAVFALFVDVGLGTTACRAACREGFTGTSVVCTMYQVPGIVVVEGQQEEGSEGEGEKEEQEEKQRRRR